MKKTNQSFAFGSLAAIINRGLITLMVCAILFDYKPSDCRPRSSSAKKSLDLFGRDTRFAKTLKSDKTSKSNKSFRAPYIKLREVPAPETIAQESTTHILQCEAGGTPAPTIHWLKDGIKINQGEMNQMNENEDIKKGKLSLSLTRSRLFLDCVNHKDDAVYSCVASSPTNRVSAETHLKVVPNLRSSNDLSNEVDNKVGKCLAKKSFGSAARIHMWTHNLLEMIGSDIQLLCRASGLPAPTTSWIGPEENTLTNSEKYKILENGDLIIRDLSWNDMGNYMCVAENQHGSDRTTLFLYPTLPEDK